jgi:predicted enzyme related to lactoylglutathione lyase
MEVPVQISDITFDCSDPERVAAFWSELLDRPIVWRKGPYVCLQRTPGSIGVGFQRVSEPKPGKNRVHLDISGPELAKIVARVEQLGGHRLDGYESGGFLVMADPEGNEFCVVPTEAVEFDSEGNTTYSKDL